MTVSLTTDGAVARLTLERPESLNALNRAVAAELEEALGRLEQSQEASEPVNESSLGRFGGIADRLTGQDHLDDCPEPGIRALIISMTPFACLFGRSAPCRRVDGADHAACAAACRRALARIMLCASANQSSTALTFASPRTRNWHNPRLRARALTHSLVAARSL